MTLVPSSFYDKDCAREYLAQVVDIAPGAEISSVFLAQFDAWFIYEGQREPALLQVLRRLLDISEYNKILCDWDGATLSLAIAQGKTLLLSNTFPATDFVTLTYYVMLSLKSLQLNPEVSSICFIREISMEDRVMLYHYFKEVKVL